MTKPVFVAVMMTLVVCACVQPRTMALHRPNDTQMTCAETAQRIAEVNAIKQLVLKENNTKKAVAGVLFFPALEGNRQNTQRTINAVNDRKKVLINVYQSNECVNTIPVYTTNQIKAMIDKNQVSELKS